MEFMKLETGNLILKKTGRLGKHTGAKHYSPFLKHNNPSFTGFDFTKTVSKTAQQVSYTNFSKISSTIDDILGDGYFSKAVKKAGLNVTVDNRLNLPNASLKKDILRTIKYPVIGLPLDLLNGMARFFKKVPVLSYVGEKLESSTILQNRAHAREIEKNLEIVTDILENFANDKILGLQSGKMTQFDSQKCAEKFKSEAADRLVKTAKNYSSRDERTLNRMATATVSALYGANDFHNISMLQKDNEAEAKKASKGRFKQEMRRMFISAGATFLTMGALDKYIKHSMWLNVLAIGVSAIIAEVFSRLSTGTPLKRLTPEEARDIALEHHPELKESLKVSNEKADDKVNFTQKIEDTNKIFVQFQSKDGNSPAMKCMKDNVVANSEPKKKKLSLGKIILAAVGIASIGYVASSAIQGKFKYKRKLKELFEDNKDKFIEHLKNPEVPLEAGVKHQFDELTKAFKERKEKFSIFKKLKEILTTRKVNVELEDMASKLKKIRQTEDGSKIEDVIRQYSEEIKTQIGKAKPDKNGKHYFEVRQNVTLLKGVYEGFAKLFNSIYTILSAPAMLIETLVDSALYKESNMAAEIIKNRKVKTSFEKELPKLYEIMRKSKVYKPNKLYSLLEKANIYTINSNKANNAAAKEILDNARNFKDSPETGELASLARTLVTLISTYFFVNDYTNRVLIESAGKDTQKAKEERNNRLAHKGANFIINGTLMNLFNSIFVKPLNRSLLGATLVAGATETTNEFLVRKSICQPTGKKHSRQEILDYEEKQLSRKGLLGAWSRLFKKITGKKTLTQQAGVKVKEDDKKVG